MIPYSLLTKFKKHIQSILKIYAYKESRLEKNLLVHNSFISYRKYATVDIFHYALGNQDSYSRGLHCP